MLPLHVATKTAKTWSQFDANLLLPVPSPFSLYKSSIDLHRGFWPAAEVRKSCLYHLGSSFNVHVCYPRGVLSTYWLAGCLMGLEIIFGTRKLVWIPRVKKKEKKE